MSAEDNTAVARVDHDLDAAVCLCHPIAFALFEGFGEAHVLVGFKRVGPRLTGRRPEHASLNWTR